MLSICWDSVGVVCARPFSVPLGYLKGWSEFLQLKHDKAKFRHPTNLKYNAPDNRLAELGSIGVAAMLIMTLLPTPITQANYNDNPPSQPGFPVKLAGAPVDLSSPTLADLDGDGKLEIVVGGRDVTGSGAPGCGGWIYAYKSDGTLYWQTHVQAPVNASPTVADLNKDGKPEVIVGLGGLVSSSICWNGGVAALNGQNGSAIWSFATVNWLGHHTDGWKDGVFASPAVADITGDGWPNVVFGAWDQAPYVLDHNGMPIWENIPGILPATYCGGHGYYNEDTIWSSPALADVNGDLVMEIITGADITKGNAYGDPSGGTGIMGTVKVSCWRRHGSISAFILRRR